MSKYIEIAPTTTLFTYDEAWLYCATLTHNGKYNWRIPTENEYLDYEIDGWLDEEKDDYVLWPQQVTPVRDV